MYTVCHPDKPLLITWKWWDRRKNLIQPLSLFTSSSSTASHYLWDHRYLSITDGRVNHSHTKRIISAPILSSQARRSEFRVTLSSFLLKKKSVTRLHAINIAFIRLWPGSQLHNCLHAGNKSLIIVFASAGVISGRGKHGNRASNFIWPGTIRFWRASSSNLRDALK
jgi:hypothetical protein